MAVAQWREKGSYDRVNLWLSLIKNPDFGLFERGFDGLIVGNATPSNRDERYSKNGSRVGV